MGNEESVKEEVMKNKGSKSSVGVKASQDKAPSSVLFLSLIVLVGLMDSRYLSMASLSSVSYFSIFSSPLLILFSSPGHLLCVQLKVESHLSLSLCCQLELPFL